MRILYIGNEIKENPKTGGEYINFRNFNVLQQVAGLENVDKVEFNTYGGIIKFSGFMKKMQIIYNILQGYMAGLDHHIEKIIYKKLTNSSYDYVFLGISQIGDLAPQIKKRLPRVKIITFFHNIEYQYFQEFVKLEGFSKIPLIWAARHNELKAIKYSDKVITLNSRDSNLMEHLYKRKADAEMGTSFIDTFKNKFSNKEKSDNENLKYLFVGSKFFANCEGIKWFIEKVMPFIPGKLIIVGKNMEECRNEFERDNVIVIGTVEILDNYYDDADIIVSPIFSGGGMKTKTAEALMYGKTIFGTDEAFEGYDLKYGYEYVGEICNTAEEYIYKIHQWIEKGKISKYNAYARKSFLENYSICSSIQTFKKIV